MELVCAHIDQCSLFLLKTQWQQSWDVFLHYRALQHTGRPSIRRCIIIDLVGCAAPPTPFGVAILVWTRSPRRQALFNFCSHLTQAVSPNHRLARSTVHYQMAWEHLKSSRCQYGAMSEPISPFCRGPNFSSRKRARRSLGVPSLSVGTVDWCGGCRGFREPFTRFRASFRGEKNPRSFRATFLSSCACAQAHLRHDAIPVLQKKGAVLIPQFASWTPLLDICSCELSPTCFCLGKLPLACFPPPVTKNVYNSLLTLCGVLHIQLHTSRA